MTAHIEAYHRLAFFAFDHGSAHRTRKGGHRAMESSAWQPSMELPNWHSDCLWKSVDLYVDILYCLWYFVDYNDYNKMSTRKPHNITSHKSYRTQTSALRLETRQFRRFGQPVAARWVTALFAVLGPVVESWKTSGIWDADGFFIWDFDGILENQRLFYNLTSTVLAVLSSWRCSSQQHSCWRYKSQQEQQNDTKLVSCTHEQSPKVHGKTIFQCSKSSRSLRLLWQPRNHSNPPSPGQKWTPPALRNTQWIWVSDRIPMMFRHHFRKNTSKYPLVN